MYRTAYRTVEVPRLVCLLSRGRPGRMRPDDPAPAIIPFLVPHVAAAAGPARRPVSPGRTGLSRVRAQRRPQPHGVRVHLRPPGRGPRPFHPGSRADHVHPRHAGLRRPAGIPARDRPSRAARSAHRPERRRPRGRSGPLWTTRREFWADRQRHEAALRENFFSFAATRQRHVGTSPDAENYDPDLWTDELAFLSRPGQEDIQTDLFYDYRTNVASYPAWQDWLRKRQPPLQVIWGRYDPSFQVQEAEAYRRDVPDAEVHVLDACDFALDEQPDVIADLTRTFRQRLEAHLMADKHAGYFDRHQDSEQRNPVKLRKLTVLADRPGTPAGPGLANRLPAAEHPVMHGQLRRRSAPDYRT